MKTKAVPSAIPVIDLTQPWTGVVPVGSVIPQPGQPRKYFDPEALAALGKSMLRRQEVACSVVPFSDPARPGVRWILVDGERRWRAASQGGLATIKVTYSPDVTLENLHTASLTSNFCRSGHTKMEIAHAIEVELKTGKSPAEIMEIVGKGVSWFYNHKCLLDLDPALQALLDAPTPQKQQIPLLVAVQLAKLPLERQAAVYRAACRKTQEGSREELQHVVRTTGATTLLRPGGETSDARYLLGQINRSKTMLGFVRSVDDEMLCRLGPDQAADALVVLETIKADAIKLRTRLEAHIERSKLQS